jgi:large subunit ribosomal protein L10
MVRNDKIELVNRVSEQLKQSRSIILANYQGLTVAEITGLRSKLRQEAVELHVIKNRLIRRALAEAGNDALDDLLHGNTIVAFGMRDPVVPAKILTEFAKTNHKLVIKGGLLEGRRIDLIGVKSLAGMPGRRELLTAMARDLKQPATRVATVVQAGLLKVAYALQALGRKLEASGANPEAPGANPG